MIHAPKQVKTFLWPAAHIFVGLLLVSVFFIAGKNVTQTFPVASMAALNNLEPQPMDYLWELNTHKVPLDQNKIGSYVDFYEHVLTVFPNLWDVYGILGYCYHYLGDDAKAIKYLQAAIQYDPDYFWNDYNLAVIYIKESRYQEADILLQKALNVSAQDTFKKMMASSWSYHLLFKTEDKKFYVDLAGHLKEAYRTSYILDKILTQEAYEKEMPAIMKKIDPELHAF